MKQLLTMQEREASFYSMAEGKIMTKTVPRWSDIGPWEWQKEVVVCPTETGYQIDYTLTPLCPIDPVLKIVINTDTTGKVIIRQYYRAGFANEKINQDEFWIMGKSWFLFFLRLTSPGFTPWEATEISKINEIPLSLILEEINNGQPMNIKVKGLDPFNQVFHSRN